jgi:hypothetical protein
VQRGSGAGKVYSTSCPRSRLLCEAVEVVPFDELDRILQLGLDARAGEKMRGISLRYALQRGVNIAVAVIGERAKWAFHDFGRGEVPDRGTGKKCGGGGIEDGLPADCDLDLRFSLGGRFLQY